MLLTMDARLAPQAKILLAGRISNTDDDPSYTQIKTLNHVGFAPDPEDKNSVDPSLFQGGQLIESETFHPPKKVNGQWETPREFVRVTTGASGQAEQHGLGGSAVVGNQTVAGRETISQYGPIRFTKTDQVESITGYAGNVHGEGAHSEDRQAFRLGGYLTGGPNMTQTSKRAVEAGGVKTYVSNSLGVTEGPSGGAHLDISNDKDRSVIDLGVAFGPVTFQAGFEIDKHKFIAPAGLANLRRNAL